MLRTMILLIAMLVFSGSAFAEQISDRHFNGGQNLNLGHKRGSDKHLAELLNAADTSLSGKLDTANLILYSSAAGAGGAATEAMTVTGLAVGDIILSVTQGTAGANSLALLGWSTPIADGLTGIWAADPGAGAILKVLIRRP